MTRGVVMLFVLALAARADSWLESTPLHFFHGSLANEQRWPSLTSGASFTNIGGVKSNEGKPVFLNDTNRYFKGPMLVHLSTGFVVGVRGVYLGHASFGGLLFGQFQDGAGGSSYGELSMRIRSVRSLYAFVQNADGAAAGIETDTTNLVLAVSNQFYVAFMRWNAATKSLCAFLNGVKGREVTNAAITANSPTNSFIGVRAYQGNLNTPNIGIVFDFAVWPWLPDEVVRHLSQPNEEWFK